MLSLESELILKQQSSLNQQNILLTGGINDDISINLIKNNKVNIHSAYFDYINSFPNLNIEYNILPTIKEEYNLIVYYWVKNKNEAIFQLEYILSKLNPSQRLWIIGNNKSGIKSVEKLFKQKTKLSKLDNARHCLLYQITTETKFDFKLEKYWTSYQDDRLDNLTIYSLVGSYSGDHLDEGTALLLSSIELKKLSGNILDLGCGSGVIGTYLKKEQPNLNITMTDINAIAIESTKRTLLKNNLSGKVMASNVFSEINDKFDLIISNPPFHLGKEVDYLVIDKILSQAKNYLKINGKIIFVANSFLPYDKIITNYFDNFKIINSTTKFKVYQITI